MMAPFSSFKRPKQSSNSNTMLLKVESYHDHTANLVTTLHPCLTTSKEEGILVSGGRKAGDLTFLHDKSVSRQHFVIRCVGTHAGMVQPRNKEEKDACKESEWKMCVIFENSGKGGSFVCSASSDSQAEKQQEYDDDSETDDEGTSQQPSANTKNTSTNASSNINELPPISATTRHHFGNQSVTLKKLDVEDDSTLILPLEDSAGSAMTDPIVIQLGRYESTIKISWVPLRVMFSSMKNSDFETSIMPRLHTIGGIRVEDTGNPTHLVTEELNAGGKQIIAWAKELPMTTSSWLKQMLARKSPADPLPNPKDHPILKNAEKKFTFWTMKPNRALLQDFTFVSVEPGTLETMAVAAGAKLVALHEVASEDRLLELAKEALEKKDTVVFIAKTRRKITKKLAALGIPQVDLRGLARSITSTKDLPVDTNHNTLSLDAIQKPAESTASTRSSRRTRRGATQETPKTVEEEDNEDEEMTPPSLGPYETQVLLEPKRMEVDDEDEEQQDTNEKNTESERIKLEKIHEQSMETEPSMLTEPSGFKQQDPQPPLEESPPAKRTKKQNTRQQNNSDHDCKLKKADSDGWFSAAPPDDSVRQEWRKTFEKYHRDDDYLDFDVTVETELVPVVIPDKVNDSNWRIPPGRKRKGVKDFRKFRKNRIIKSDPRITIKFSKVGSKATDEQEETYETQEQELAEEQRLADELFRNDGGFGGGRKRRRRIA